MQILLVFFVRYFPTLRIYFSVSCSYTEHISGHQYLSGRNGFWKNFRNIDITTQKSYDKSRGFLSMKV